MSKLIDADALKEKYTMVTKRYSGGIMERPAVLLETIEDAPTIDAVRVVRCKECKHRPIKEDPNEENYGFNLIEPTEGDERCPCLVSDGWYSWMPKDDFYCGFGERRSE